MSIWVFPKPDDFLYLLEKGADDIITGHISKSTAKCHNRTKRGLGIQLWLFQVLRNMLICPSNKMLNEVFGKKPLHNLSSIYDSKISRILYENIKRLQTRTLISVQQHLLTCSQWPITTSRFSYLNGGEKRKIKIDQIRKLTYSLCYTLSSKYKEILVRDVVFDDAIHLNTFLNEFF